MNKVLKAKTFIKVLRRIAGQYKTANKEFIQLYRKFVKKK